MPTSRFSLPVQLAEVAAALSDGPATVNPFPLDSDEATIWLWAFKRARGGCAAGEFERNFDANGAEVTP